MTNLRPIGPGRDPAARRKFARDVKAYQMANKLHQDGIVGTQTYWFMHDTIADLKVKLARDRQPDDPGPAPQPTPAFRPAHFVAGFVFGAVATLTATGALF